MRTSHSFLPFLQTKQLIEKIMISCSTTKLAPAVLLPVTANKRASYPPDFASVPCVYESV